MTYVIPSKMAYSFIISNASHSMHCSSVEAYLLWKCCSHILIFVAKCDAQSKAGDILLVLTSVAGNLCNKCPSSYSNKTAVKVILSMRSLVSIEQQSPGRPCDTNIPWSHSWLIAIFLTSTVYCVHCIHCIHWFDLFAPKTMSPSPYTSIPLHPRHTASTAYCVHHVHCMPYMPYVGNLFALPKCPPQLPM